MKHTKILIAVVLLFALLLSSCGQAAPQAAETVRRTVKEAPAPAAAGRVELLSAYHEAPAAGTFALPLSAPGQVTPTTVEHNTMFRAKFEGNSVSGRGEVVDGVYRFAADKTDGEAWHVKLECNYPTVAGRDYRVTYRFRSDVAGKVKFGDFQEFDIHEGENSVTGVLIATSGTSYLDLQLGMLPAFTIDFTEIEIEEYADEVDYENALTVPVNFEKESLVWEKHDQGYAPVLTRSRDEVTVDYLATSWDNGVWKSRLYIKTGMIPESSVHYRVTADVTCDQDLPFEVLLNNGEEEKGYGALYGQNAAAGKTMTCESVITGSGEGDELIMQFSLGDAPEGSAVKIGNLHVEKIKDHYSSVLPPLFALDTSVETGKMLYGAIPTSFKNVPLSFSYSGIDTVYSWCADGYVVALDEGASSATLKISQAPESGREGWKAKLCAATGVTPAAGETYKVSFDVSATGDQAKFEVTFDGNAEKDYGAIYEGLSLTAGGTKSVEYTFTPVASCGPLTVQLQLGETNTTAGNNITLSNLSVCPIKNGEAKEVELTGFAYPEAAESSVEPNSFSLEANSGAAASLTGDGSSATATVETPGADWNVKFYAKPGVTLEAGTQYRVSFNVTNASGCKACFKDLSVSGDNAETAYGEETISSDDQTVTKEIQGSGGVMEIMLKIGNVPAGTAVKVSDVKIEKTEGSYSQITLTGFSYPTVTGGSTEPNSFALEANSGAAAEMTGNGSSATATVTTPVADWNVKFYAKPGLELKAGTQYQVSFNVTNASGCKACFKDLSVSGDNAETAYGEETISADNQTVTKMIQGSGGVMEIMLKIGNVPAGTAVTISNVNIKEQQTTPKDKTPGTINYYLEPPASGASATQNVNSVTVDTPTPADEWKIKFYVQPNMALESGKTYQVSFNVTNANGCLVCFKDLSVSGDGAETAYGEERLSSDNQTVTKVIQGSGGVMEIMLKLGKAQPGAVVTVSDVHISELNTAFVDVTLSGFAYPVTTAAEIQEGSFDLEANNGAAASLGGNGSSATATVTTPVADWNVKFYAKPGVTLEAGTQYRVSFNVTNASGCKACFKDLSVSGDSAETAYGEETISSDDQTVTKKIQGSGGVMEIILKIGNVPANTVVKVSDIHIEKYASDGGDVLPESFRYPEMVPGGVTKNSFDLEANSGAEAALTGDGSSATATVIKSGDDWHIKFYAKPGVELETGKSYQVTMQVKNGNSATVSFKNTANGKEDGFGTESITSNDQTITHTIAPTEKGGMEILLKIGNLPAGTAVTVSDIKLKAAESTEGENVIPSFSYDSVGYVSRAADDGYVTLLEQGSSSATLHILQAPASDRNFWNVKFNVKTGFTPEKNKGYRVSYGLTAAKSQSAFEVFYDGNTESAYGAQYAQSLSSGKNSFAYIIYPGESKGELVLQLRCGKTDGTDGNTYTFSNLKIEEVAFRYTQTPEVKKVTTLDTQNGYIEQLDVTRDKATVRIEKTPATGREAWKSKLFVETGVTLNPGQKYRVSMDVRSIIPAPFEVCFNNGGVEKGLGAIFGLISTPAGQHVEYVTYAKEATQLVIQLSLGNCSPPNSIILSNVKVEKAGAIDLVSDTIYTF